MTALTQSAYEKHRSCQTCQRVLPYSSFSQDRKEKDGISHVCRTCVQGTTPVAAAPGTWRGDWLECRACHKIKSSDEFYLDSKRNHGSARGGRRYHCKECDSARLKESQAKARMNAAQIQTRIGTGLRIHVGEGLVEQHPVEENQAEENQAMVVETRKIQTEEGIEKAVGTQVLAALPMPDVVPYADMTLQEWLDLDQVPSVFVISRLALVLTRQDGASHIAILSISGEGPGQQVDAPLASYIVGILTHQHIDTLHGTMFY